MDHAYDPPARFETASDLLHEVVSSEIGWSDFGADDYRTGLSVLLASMDYDPRFSERGRRMAWNSVIAALRARGLAHRALAEHPGHSDEPIVAPIVITGIPRSGTTALHRLMALDPRMQGLQTWLLDAPMPRPPREEWEAHPAFQRSVAAIEARSAAAPSRVAAHQSAAEGLEECCTILRHSFVSNIWNCMGWSSASYDAWWQTQSEAEAYRYFARCVRLIGLNDRRRWLLKNPGHIEHLHEVFAVFPDARVIHTHRDPAKAVPSLCALLDKLHPVLEDGRYEQRKRLMARRESEKWANAVRKAEAVKAAHPGQAIDVVHGDFHGDPMGVLERIYRFIGLEIDESLRAAFAQRIAEKPELAHGEHRYTLADYGMSPDQLREIFGDYTDRYAMRETAR